MTADREQQKRVRRSRTRIISLLFLFLILYLALCGSLAWETVRPKHRRPAQTPEQRGMASVSVQFVSQDRTLLRGWYLPAAGHAKGVVVCCHGVDSTREDLLYTAEILHKADYAVLLFDFRARGESGGRLCTLGSREVEDLQAAIEFAQSSEPHLPLGLLGESMGGAVALMGAARSPRVRCVIAESPFASLDHAVANHFHGALGAGGFLLGLPTRWIGQWLIGRNCADIAPVQEIARIAPRPLLLIEDGADTLCPPEETQALYQAAGQTKSLWTVPNATHIAAKSVAPAEYAHRIVAFYDANLAHP